jgi:ABC-type transport system involved in multi-copper enzyme maturation permease subunit
MTITAYRPPQQAGRESFAQLVRAEWTKFRTLRGWVIAIVIAAVLIDVVGVLVPRGDTQCGTGSGAACLAHVATGPGGEAVNDSYYLASQPLAGNGSITVRVTSLTGEIAHDGGFSGPGSPPPGTMSPGLVPWAKAGIMVTDGTRPGAAYAAMMVTGSHGVRMQYDYTGDIAGASGSNPRWLRLTRDGDVITGYDSADGAHWAEVGKVQLAGAGAVQAGMFATSPLDFTPNFPTYGESGGSTSNSVATGTFDNVGLRGGAPGGRWAGRYVGAGTDSNGPQPAGIGFREAGGSTFTVTGSGDIGPVVAGMVNSGYDAGTIADHLLGVFIALLIMVVIAAMFITVEYRRGLIRTTLAASPRRGRLLAAKAVVIGAVTFILGSAAVATAVIVGSNIAHDSGMYVLPVSWLTQARVILGTGAMLALASALALSIGTMLRRSVVTVAAVIVAIVLPYILGVSGVLPASAAEWVLRVTPAAGFAIEQSVPQYQQVVGHYGPPDYFPLAPWAGLAVLCLYAAAGLGLAAWLLRRRDA